MTPERLAHLHAQHHPGPEGQIDEHLCAACDQVWPCEVAELLAEVERIHTDLKALIEYSDSEGTWWWDDKITDILENR